MHAIWVFVTDSGDSAVTVPLALLTLAFLIAGRHPRIAFGWTLAIGGCALAIGVLKLAFGACGERIPLGHIVSPSGHTAMSTAIYGSLALLVGAGLQPSRRIAVCAVAAVAITGIALSRLVLHEHNLPEIVLGGVVGVGAVAFFGAALRRETSPAIQVKWLLLCGAVLIAAMHGQSYNSPVKNESRGP